MDRQYPQLFGMEKPLAVRETLLGTGGSYPCRANRGVWIGGEDHIQRPPRINHTAFYQAFNRISADFHLERKEKKIPIKYPPLLFTLDGKFIDIRANNTKQLEELFDMPSSCKDIRMFPLTLLHFARC